jgi:hypothetical protein
VTEFIMSAERPQKMRNSSGRANAHKRFSVGKDEGLEGLAIVEDGISSEVGTIAPSALALAFSAMFFIGSTLSRGDIYAELASEVGVLGD